MPLPILVFPCEYNNWKRNGNCDGFCTNTFID